MRKLVLIFGSVFTLSFSASAQKLSGVVKDDQGKGLDKTTISLLRAKDSSVVKLAVTGNDGSFSLETNGGSFLVSASHIGYATRYSAVTEVKADTRLPEIVLEKLTDCPFPVCFDFPVGHQKHNLPLKCGVPHRLEVTETGVSLQSLP